MVIIKLEAAPMITLGPLPLVNEPTSQAAPWDWWASQRKRLSCFPQTPAAVFRVGQYGRHQPPEIGRVVLDLQVSQFMRDHVLDQGRF